MWHHVFATFITKTGQIPEPYSEPSRNQRWVFFAEIVNGYQPLTIFAKSFILDVRLGSENTSLDAADCVSRENQ